MSLNLLLKSKKTVFRVEDIGKILGIANKKYLLVYINRMKKRGEIEMVKKGIYVLNKNYNILELANKIKSPSYVSLQTVLYNEGIIFQDFTTTITSVSNNSYKIKLTEKLFVYHKIKETILTNPLGIIFQGMARVAIKERAIADTLYLFGDYYFDNLENVDKKLLLQIGKNYNLKVIKRIKKICSI